MLEPGELPESLMRLSDFITRHMEDIIAEWESFARSQIPAARDMSELALGDHAEAMLKAVALDIESEQTSSQQYAKSQGRAPAEDGADSAAVTHGQLRHASEFSLLQLSAEFRALRATVLRLWLKHCGAASGDAVTEIIRFNEAIDQALAESIEAYSGDADETRELFLAILGHDLRAPLATMAMAGDMFLHPDITPAQTSRLASRVTRASRQMSGMVQDLLGYTRTRMGSGMPINRRPLGLDDVIAAAVDDASAMHPEHTYERQTTGDLHGSFDAVRIQQLLTNLLVNAGQHGARNRPVVMSAEGDADDVILRVTNHGLVIPAAALESIFKPLTQLPSNDPDPRSSTSLGLGLFIAREIALGHGGTIRATSSEQGETTFTARIPRTAERSPSSDAANPPKA